MPRLLSNIRFWIVLFFLIRLYGITQAPLEIGHNWRQSTVTMVARNFLEIDNNILYPRIDIAGNKTGITGMEFPIFNYLIYLCSEIFGYQHWYGRLINLICSSLGLWFFFGLVKRYFGDKTALFSTIILAVSIWFQFSRKIMPDTFSMSLIIAGLYFASNYLEHRVKKAKHLALLLFFALTCIGTLSKLPSAYLLVVLTLFIFNQSYPTKEKIILCIAAFVAVIPAMVWYFYWVPNLVEQFGFWHFFMGKDLSTGFSEIAQNLNLTLKRFYESALKYIAFAAFLFGLIQSILKKNKALLAVFSLCFVAFLLVVFKAGFTFYHHNYYIIPFVPVMALLAGYGVSHLPKPKVSTAILTLIVLEGVINQAQDFSIKNNHEELLNLEEQLDQFSTKSDLFLINSGEYPTPMYFAHRKGWVDFNDKIADAAYIAELKSKGLSHILILKKAFGTNLELASYTLVENNETFPLYRVD